MTLDEKMKEIWGGVCFPSVRMTQGGQFLAAIRAEDQKCFTGEDVDPVAAFEKAQAQLSEYRNAYAMRML